MVDNKVYEKLIEYQKNYPALTFDNNGYEYLPMEVRETHKEQITEIETLLNGVVEGFVKFNNFKPRRDGSFAIRHQCYWDETFIGVGYIEIDKLKQ